MQNFICRPAYLELGSLRSQYPSVPIIAVTATATPSVQDCIKDSLKLRDCLLLKASFNRKNCMFEVRHKELIGNGEDKDAIQARIESTQKYTDLQKAWQ